MVSRNLEKEDFLLLHEIRHQQEINESTDRFLNHEYLTDEELEDFMKGG